MDLDSFLSSLQWCIKPISLKELTKFNQFSILSILKGFCSFHYSINAQPYRKRKRKRKCLDDTNTSETGHTEGEEVKSSKTVIPLVLNSDKAAVFEEFKIEIIIVIPEAAHRNESNSPPLVAGLVFLFENNFSYLVLHPEISKFQIPKYHKELSNELYIFFRSLYMKVRLPATVKNPTQKLFKVIEIMEKRLGKSVLVLPQQYMTNDTEKSKELIDNFHDGQGYLEKYLKEKVECNMSFLSMVGDFLNDHARNTDHRMVESDSDLNSSKRKKMHFILHSYRNSYRNSYIPNTETKETRKWLDKYFSKNLTVCERKLMDHLFSQYEDVSDDVEKVGSTSTPTSTKSLSSISSLLVNLKSQKGLDVSSVLGNELDHMRRLLENKQILDNL